MTLYVLSVVLGLLQLGDWYTTRTSINSGKAHEANPVAAWLMGRLTMEGYLAIKAIVVAAAGYAIGLQSLSMLAALCVFYAYVIYGNWGSCKC